MDWFRSYHGAPTDPKWRLIALRVTQCNAATVTVTPGCVAAVFWSLLDYASQQQERGSVIDFDTETLASAFDWPEEKVTAIIGGLKTKNVIVNNRLSAWDKRQPIREDDSRDRVRRHREKKQVTHGNGAVTHGNGAVTPDREIDRTDEIERKKDTVPTVLRASPAPHPNGKSNGSENGHLAAPVGTSLSDNATLTPAELRREFWRSSVAYLKRCGIKDARSRELLGSWCKRSDQGTVIQLLGQAEVSAIIDPVPYIEAALKKNATNRNLKNGNGHSDSGNAYGSREWFAQAVKANWDFAPGEKEKYETKYGAIQ